jgi:hypothetical protein
MLSSFLKRLLFARQLVMDGGKITLLGENQIMLPADVIKEIERKGYNPKPIKEIYYKKLKSIVEKTGLEKEGTLNVLKEIFEAYGLGKLNIIDLDNKKNTCLVNVKQFSLTSYCSGIFSNQCVLLCSALSGFFSYFFDKDVDCKIIKCNQGGEFNCQYLIK